ncbi:snn-1 [Pristionchus pacificus]|uniref:Snn-1 n=1 Tax=Pristionchus pacificus TaxID=54126 RepID=A0A2A6BYY7_PRIPA|nr:snn-1 [Pristionchus pacificus]|eukprot:PDM71079.1 snn-1 [Pristionchus pacificus]
MNFFKRKFSFTDEDENGELSLDEVSSSPPSSFSLSKMAERVSSTISAPTSPVRSSDTLVRALERSLQPSSIQPPQLYAPDAKTILIIDDDLIDWSKYFKSSGISRIRVEQANFCDVHIQSTEHNCIVEIQLREGESKHMNIDAFIIGPDASFISSSDRIIRSLITASIPSLNSSSSIISFLSLSDLKKELRRSKLPDGSTIPFLPSIHYPSFHKFNPTNHFPIVVSIGNGRKGQGKIKVNSSEELSDLEGIIYKTSKNEEVEVEPFVDIKYDIHVQKIGNEIKSFVRRGISSHWKSNATSAVLEQVKNNNRHIEYLTWISHSLGGCRILSIDILVAKDGREFVHSCSDRLRYFGESQEEDRRQMCNLIQQLLFPIHNNNLNTQTYISKKGTLLEKDDKKEEKSVWHPSLPTNQLHANGKDCVSGEDTMGQLKRTFAGIFGELSIS